MEIGTFRDSMQANAGYSVPNDQFERHYQEARSDVIEPLPQSPCLKIKKTGQIVPWHSSFAQHPDLCECCDKYGKPWKGPSAPVQEKPVINTDISHVNVRNDHTVPVGIASERLGVDKQFSQDFSQPSGNKDAFRIPEQSTSMDMSSIINACFQDNIKR